MVCPYVGRSPKILEIGIQNGGDAEMWLKYFGPGTKIVGVDIDERCKLLEDNRLKIVVGDQGNKQFWNSFPESDFDIIIDDGSHDNPHQILTLIETFNLLKTNGIYWCEDCLTSYWPSRAGGGLKNSNSFMEFSKQLIDVLHFHHIKNKLMYENVDLIDIFYNTIQGIHFYDCIVVIEKGEKFVYKRIIKSERAKTNGPS